MSWKFYPQFLTEPTLDEMIRAGVTGDNESYSIGFGETFVSFKKRRSRTWEATFQTFSEQEWTALREFLSSVSGRAKAFYVPSWQADLSIVEDADSGDDEIVVAGHAMTDSTQQRFPDSPGRVIMVTNEANQRSVHWITVKAVTGANDRLTITPPLGQDIRAGKAVVSFVWLARLIEDEIRVQSISPRHHRATLRFRDVTETRQRAETLMQPFDNGVDELRDFLNAIATGAAPDTFDHLSYTTRGPDALGTAQDYWMEESWTATVGRETNQFSITGALDAGPHGSTLYDAAEVPDQIAITFDQTSREIVAWVKDGTLRARWWNPDGVTAESRNWKAYSVAAMTTQALDAEAETSEAVSCIFYLQPDDSTIYFRTSSDDYVATRRFCTGPLAPLALYGVERDDTGEMAVVGMDSQHRITRWTTGIYTPPEEPESIDIAIHDFDAWAVYRRSGIINEYVNVSTTEVAIMEERTVGWTDSSGNGNDLSDISPNRLKANPGIGTVESGPNAPRYFRAEFPAGISLSEWTAILLVRGFVSQLRQPFVIRDSSTQVAWIARSDTSWVCMNTSIDNNRMTSDSGLLAVEMSYHESVLEMRIDGWPIYSQLITPPQDFRQILIGGSFDSGYGIFGSTISAVALYVFDDVGTALKRSPQGAVRWQKMIELMKAENAGV